MDIPNNVKKYCETCLAKKGNRKFECDIQNAISGDSDKKCYKVVLNIPGRKEEIVANCACVDEARIYCDYLSNAIYVGVKQY